MSLLRKFVEKGRGKMGKKIILTLTLFFSAAQFTGCSGIESIEKTGGDSFTISDTDEPQSSLTVTVPENPAESEAPSGTSEPQSEASSESAPETELPSTEPPRTNPPQTEPTPTEESPNTPQWSETKINGERYINTDNIYSRVNAIQGSSKVRQYGLNDKVKVVAKTDTNYYKLDDGTFIHADYLSENKISDNSQSGNNGGDYRSVTTKGYVIERINGITYIDGIMIANKTYNLPSDYDPGVKKEAADALAELQAAAASDGLSFFIVSGYRSYNSQKSVYAGWVNQDGAEKADTYSSRPGHSDHQTGYTFDLNSLNQSFAYTAEGKWLAAHCADFGFIIRYPEGKEAYTGYMYEPWHIRYIGKEKAKIISESGLSLEEYYGFTSVYADSVQ